MAVESSVEPMARQGVELVHLMPRPAAMENVADAHRRPEHAKIFLAVLRQRTVSMGCAVNLTPSATQTRTIVSNRG